MKIKEFLIWELFSTPVPCSTRNSPENKRFREIFITFRSKANFLFLLVERYLERYGHWNVSLPGQAFLQNIPLGLLDLAVPPLHEVIRPDPVLPSDPCGGEIPRSKQTVDVGAGDMEDFGHIRNRQERAVLVEQIR